MEPNAALAEYDPERDRLTLHSVTQVPYYVHLTLARCLRMDESRIRVVKPFVGGGFGHRTETLNFEIIAALLARAAGGTVKLELSREETFLTHRGRPETEIRLKLGLKKIGRDHRRRLRSRAARRRLRRLRPGHDPLRGRAAARALSAARLPLPRPARLQQHAAERRDARPRLGRRSPRVRVDARSNGRGARPRSVRGATRKSAGGAAPDDQRPAGQFVRARPNASTRSSTRRAGASGAAGCRRGVASGWHARTT